MAISTIQRTTASGSTAVFSVPFPYLDKAHVQVRLNGVLKTLGADYTFPTSSTIQITAGNPTAGTVVERRRGTPSDPLTVFQPGNLDSGDLNVAELQPLYVAQEAFDLASDFLASAWVGANSAPGGTITPGGSGNVLVFDDGGDIIDGEVTIATLLAASQQAQDARDQTLAAFDDFDDRYLGHKASDPTLDNDGNALVGGTIYFNTTAGQMRVYDGSVWVAAYVSGADYPLKSNNGSDYTAATFRTNLSLYSKAEVDGFAVKLTGAQTVAGVKTFSSAPVVPNGAWGYAAMATAAIVTAAEYRVGTATKLLPLDQVNAAMAEVALTDAATILWDMSSGVDFTVTLGGNRTLGNPSNCVVGRRGRIRVVQDGTGSRTLTKSSNHKTAGGAVLSLSTVAASVDYIDYDCRSATDIRLSLSRAWS